MSETNKTTAEELLRGYGYCINEPPCPHCIASALDDAEERGRRAGIEEAHGILADALKQWPASGLDYVLQKIAALAPRDSGKTTDDPRDVGKEVVPVLYPAQDGTCMYCHERHPGVCGAMNGQEDRK